MGLPFGTATERTKMLGEELEIIRRLWTEDRTSFQGEYFHVQEAVNSPKPVQKPYPEIHIAFRNPKFLPKIAARFANRVNLMGGDDSGIEKAKQALQKQCEVQGRDYESIKKGRLASILFVEDEVEPQDRRQVIRQRAIEIGIDADELIEEHERYVVSYIGPPSECAEALLKRTVALGINELVLCIDTFGVNSYDRTMAGLRRFAEHVMPSLLSL